MTPIEQPMRAQQNSWRNRLVSHEFAVTTVTVTTQFSDTDSHVYIVHDYLVY